MSQTEIVWSLNKALPELKQSNDNIDDAIREYHKFNEKSYSQPLKNIIDEVYYELNIPMDIINQITIFNSGGIVYNYSKRFAQFTQNTIYITPIIFGYIETLLFFLICTIPIIDENALLPISLLYALILIIHGICALCAYHECKEYEKVIRNFKRALYSNNEFINHLKWIENKENDQDNNDFDDLLLTTDERTEMKIYDNDNDNNWHWTSIYKTDRDSDKLLLSMILNPSNNTFAWIAYQRWSNVKMLELKNDSFTRSKAALCLSLSKYWLPSYFILSIIILIYTPTIISIIWWILYIHSFYGFLYCYYRVVKNINKREALIITVIAAAIQDIIAIIIVIVIVTTDNNNDGNVDTNTGKDAFFWMFDIIFPVLYSLCCIIYSKWVIRILWNIIKYNIDIIDYGGYKLWWYLLMVVTNIYFLFLAPSWRILEISVIFFVLMIIFYYLNMQQLVHRIMTGMKKQIYIKNFIANNPQKWLKQELKLLFIPYIK